MKRILVCIDIGGTSIKAGICDMEGGLGAQEILPIHQDIEQLLEEIGKYVKQGKRIGRDDWDRHERTGGSECIYRCNWRQERGFVYSWSFLDRGADTQIPSAFQY